MRHLGWLTIVAMGCGEMKAAPPGGTDGDLTEGADATEDLGCDYTVSELFPDWGAVDVDVTLKEIRVSLATEEITSLTVNAPGQAFLEGSSARYAIDGVLTPDTLYTVRVETCGGTYDLSGDFTTGRFGEPVEDWQSVVGGVWAVQLTDASIIWDLYARHIYKEPFLVGVTGVNGSDVELLAGAAVEAGVDVCAPTPNVVGPADFSGDPWGRFHLDRIPGQMGIDLWEPDVEATFSPDGHDLRVHISGWYDARVAYLAVPGTESAEDFCGLIDGFGYSCEPCGDGSPEPLCVWPLFEGIRAVPAPGAVIGQVTAEDVAANPACSD